MFTQNLRVATQTKCVATLGINTNDLCVATQKFFVLQHRESLCCNTKNLFIASQKTSVLQHSESNSKSYNPPYQKTRFELGRGLEA